MPIIIYYMLLVMKMTNDCLVCQLDYRIFFVTMHVVFIFVSVIMTFPCIKNTPLMHQLLFIIFFCQLPHYSVSYVHGISVSMI